MIDDEVPASAQARIEEIVRRLAAGDIDGLRSEGVEGLEDDPLLWVREYPAELVPLPGDVLGPSRDRQFPVQRRERVGGRFRYGPPPSRQATCRWRCR